MDNNANKLKIKYGLTHTPSSIQINQWVDKTFYYKNIGYTLDEAGKKAAKDVFSDFNTMLYRSQADDILTILQSIKGK